MAMDLETQTAGVAGGRISPLVGIAVAAYTRSAWKGVLAGILVELALRKFGAPAMNPSLASGFDALKDIAVAWARDRELAATQGG